MILNPASYTGNALKLKPQIEDYLNRLEIDYTLHISKNSEDIISTVKKNLDDFSNFVSVGGDGTLHHIANAIAGTGKNLGSIPLGSGNDISNSLGISSEIESACKTIKRCFTRKMDLGRINGQYYYLGVSGAGFDSVVTDLANNTRFPVKGPSKYKYAVYRTLLTFTSKNFYIRHNGEKKTVNGMMLAIGNTDMYGGGMKITPMASPFDGILDICILKRMSKIHFIKTFPLVFKGKHVDDPFIEYFMSKNLEVDSDYNFSVFADGEYICKLPVRYEIVPEALNIIVNEPSHRSS